MAERTVVVYLKLNDSQFSPMFAKAGTAAKTFGKDVTGATDSAKKGIAGLGISAKQIAGGLGFAGIAVGVGKMATAFVGFGTAMSGVSAATMATKGDLDQLRQAALAAGQGTQYSATEAAQGITELAKAGVSTADIMGGGLAGALNLAAAGGLEVARAAEIAATALSIFGLKGSDMSHVADLLAAGSGKAQGSVNDMAMALQQSALVAKNTGLSIEDTTGALALFASKGLLGSDAGTSFKTMLMSLNPRSKEAANLMDELGIRAYDAAGQFIGLQAYAGQLQSALSGLTQEQRNAALQTIFGTDAVRAATALYEAGANGVSKWVGQVNDSGYAAEQAARLTDNLAGDVERFGGALETAFIGGGGKADAALRKLVQQLTEMVPAAAEVVTAIFQVGSSLASVAALGLAAFAPILTLLGNLAGAIGGLPAPLLAAAAGLFAIVKLQGPASLLFTSIGVLSLEAKDKVAGLTGGVQTLRGRLAAAQANAGGLGRAFVSAVGPGNLLAGVFLGIGIAVMAAIESHEKFIAAQKAITASLMKGETSVRDYMGTLSAPMPKSAGGIFDTTLGEGAFQNAAAVKSMSQQITNLYEEAEKSGAKGDVLKDIAGKAQAAQAALDEFGPTSSKTAAAFDELYEAVGKTAPAIDTAGESTSALTELVGTLGGVTEETTSKVQALQDSFDKLVNPAINADQALIAQIDDYYKLIEAVQKKIEAGDAEALSLDLNTASGRENVGMIGDQIKALQDAAVARAVESGSAAEGMAIWNAGTAALREQLLAMGFLPAEVDTLLASYSQIPAEIGTEIELHTQSATENLAAWIAANSNKVIPAHVKLVYDASQVTAADQYIKAPGGRYADGGFAFFGKGGFASFAGGKEAHYAHIAGAGTNRMWAEPETGGEGYVPLGQSKRAQSKAIVQQIVDRFGGQVAWAPERSIPPSTAAAGQMSKIARSTQQTVTALQEQMTAITNVLVVDGQVLHRSVQYAKRDRDRRGGPS